MILQNNKLISLGFHFLLFRNYSHISLSVIKTEIIYVAILSDACFSLRHLYSVISCILRLLIYIYIYKGKAIPLQALTGPEGSKRLTLPDFKTMGT
jgi:hypothetical protein